MISYGTPRERVRRGACVGSFLFLGWLATGGAWSAFLWIRYGDPVFPYLNGIFRSDQWLPMSFRDTRFGPRTLLQWLAFPLYFSWAGHALVGEVEFRDYRFATLWVLGVAALAWLIVRGRPRPGAIPVPWKIAVVFALVSYVAWLAVFGYYRYAVPLEMLSGPFICGAVAFAFRKRAAAGMTALLILAALLVGTTRKMGWERVAFGAKYFEVTVPPVDEGALVVLSGNHPMAFTAPFFPAGTRFVSIQNNFIFLGQESGLARRAESMIRSHRGALYLLDRVGGWPESVKVLEYFGFARGACEPVQANLSYNQDLQLCKLRGDARR
jgi:hypothetical protein